MNFFFQPTAFSSVFTVPCAVTDEHLKLASAAQIKVLLFLLRHLSDAPDVKTVALSLSLSESETEDACRYWVSAGILGSDTQKVGVAEDTVSKPVVRRAVRPTREDVARRGDEDERLRFLLQEAQVRFGRTLKSSEASTILWLYDDEGMAPSVILLLLQYAVTEDRCNISFIEKTAVSWIKKGVQSVADAEREMEAAAERKTAWHVVERAFGMEYRRPSEREAEWALLWVRDWQVSEELLKCAYDTCIDAKSKLSVPYIAKVLEGWHKKGFKTAEDVDQEKQKKKVEKAHRGAAYDLDLFERMLNQPDEE